MLTSLLLRSDEYIPCIIISMLLVHGRSWRELLGTNKKKSLHAWFSMHTANSSILIITLRTHKTNYDGQ